MRGIRSSQREIVLEKINKAIAFQAKLFSVDVSVIKEWSINPFINSKKYYAEFQNRVNSTHKLGYDDLGFIPSFVTITAPSRFHKVENFESYDDMLREAYEYLAACWRSFLNLSHFRKVKKIYGEREPYYKILEPMKSGVPHFHIIIYVPKEFVKEFRKIVSSHFEGFTKVKTFFKKYKNGTHGVIAYVSKYVSKLVRSLELDDVGVWYCYYRFRIFTTSRSLCPLYIHRKIKRFEDFQSMYETTIKLRQGSIHWNFGKQLLRSKDIGILHFFPASKRKKDLCSDMQNSESWLRHKRFIEDKNKPIVKFTKIAYFGKDGNIIYAPVVPFAKMTPWELHTTYQRLRFEYNPFVDFEVERFRICERVWAGLF